MKNTTLVLLVSLPLFGLSACQDTSAGGEDAQNGNASVAAASCHQCGEIESITPRTVKGEPRAGAAVAGAVIGGVVGHQFGSGSGNDAATAAGAIGGAVAGSEIDRQRNATTEYDVVVRMDSGDRVQLTRTDISGLSVGDEVEVRGSSIVPTS